MLFSLDRQGLKGDRKKMTGNCCRQNATEYPYLPSAISKKLLLDRNPHRGCPQILKFYFISFTDLNKIGLKKVLTCS